MPLLLLPGSPGVLVQGLVAQVLVEAGFTPDDVERVSQFMAEAAYTPDDVERVSQLVLEVGYEVPSPGRVAQFIIEVGFIRSGRKYGVQHI